MQSLAQQFLTFCRSKPSEEEYVYCGWEPCACEQFLRAQGIPHGWTDGSPRETLEWRFGAELQGLPSTFSALADRLEAHLARQPIPVTEPVL